MALTALGPSWTDGVEVQEKKLQEYFLKKNHKIQLQGAAETLKHTLTSVPTTTASDGLVHLGDSLMLRSAATGGLLQADIEDKIQVNDASRPGAVGASLSTGQMLFACARNVLTVSRVDDNDGFPEDGCLHYGQAIRLGASAALQDRPLYLFAQQGRPADQAGDAGAADEDEESAFCLYQRATAGSLWRVVRAQAPPKGEHHDDDLVRLGAPVRLEPAGAASSSSSAPAPAPAPGRRRALGSDAALKMTSYGNEHRVFARPLPPGGPVGTEQMSQVAWSFVDSQWAEEVVAAARKAGGEGYILDDSDDAANPHAAQYLAGLYIPQGWGGDAGELLQSSQKRAEHELALLDGEQGAAARKVLARIIPTIRRSGMHVARKLRRMCIQADTHSEGALSLRSFSGVLSWTAIRLKDEELFTLLEILSPPGQDVEMIDYRRFFALMSPPLGEVRGGAVRDAYAKLRAQAAGHLVEVMDLQRNWDPTCHPEVQAKTLSKSEARAEFLRQWDVSHPDALVSYEEFLDYYQDVSMAVENDEVFVEIVRRAWGL